MIEPALIEPDRLRPLRRMEYERLVGLGYFEDEHLELLGGALVQSSRQSPAHAELVSALSRMFVLGIGDRGSVRVRSPLAVSDVSEPEPDLAIVPLGDYRRAHPTGALLVIEVAERSRRKHRVLKAEIYASAAIPEYWLVDLEARRLEVRTRPEGSQYLQLATYNAGLVSPSALPDITISLSELLD